MGLTVREALAARDFDAFVEVLAPDVVWVGVLPGQLCRNRDEVVETFRRARGVGRRSAPEILAETDDMFVIDPHVDPPPELNPELHQVLVVREERVVELRDYPNRGAALAAVDAR